MEKRYRCSCVQRKHHHPIFGFRFVLSSFRRIPFLDPWYFPFICYHFISMPMTHFYLFCDTNDTNQLNSLHMCITDISISSQNYISSHFRPLSSNIKKLFQKSQYYPSKLWPHVSGELINGTPIITYPFSSGLLSSSSWGKYLPLRLHIVPSESPASR